MSENALSTQAMLYWQMGDWNNIVLLENDENVTNTHFKILLASAYTQLGDFSNAKANLKFALSSGCDKKLVKQIMISTAYLTLGRLALLDNNPDKAKSFFDHAWSVLGLNNSQSLNQHHALILLSQISQVNTLDTISGQIHSFLSTRPAVSIIVPFYNLENELDACLNSIAKQTFRDFEVILISDCSVDSSLLIAESWTKKDNRFTLYKNERNEGVSFSRNKGLKLSKGEFIRFVDGDDELPPNSMHDLMACSTNQDMVRGSYITLKLDGSTMEDFVTGKPIIDVHPFMIPERSRSRLLYGITAVLIRRSILLDYFFSVGKQMAEDTTFLMDLFFSLERVSLIPNVVYIYKKRSDSLSEVYNLDITFFIDTFNRWYHFGILSKKYGQMEFASFSFGNALKYYFSKEIIPKIDLLKDDEKLEAKKSLSTLLKLYEIDTLPPSLD